MLIPLGRTGPVSRKSRASASATALILADCTGPQVAGRSFALATPVGAILAAVLIWYAAPTVSLLARELGRNAAYPPEVAAAASSRAGEPPRSVLAVGGTPDLLLSTGASIFSVFPHSLFLERSHIAPGASGDAITNEAWRRLAGSMRECAPDLILLEREYWAGGAKQVGSRVAALARKFAEYRQSEAGEWLMIEKVSNGCAVRERNGSSLAVPANVAEARWSEPI